MFTVRRISGRPPLAKRDLQSCAADLKELASDSLSLLKEFLYDERFPALFDLSIYGSIIGMFELNNLSEPSSANAGYHARLRMASRSLYALQSIEVFGGILPARLSCTAVLRRHDVYASCAGLYIASPVEDYAIAATMEGESTFDPMEQHMASLVSSENLQPNSTFTLIQQPGFCIARAHCAVPVAL